MFKKLIIVSAVVMLSANVAASNGQEIAEKSCQGCHAAGVANAPKTGDKAAWEPRIAKGMDAMLKSVKEGLNAMPPKAMCNDCSDDDFKAAIEYMAK